MELSDEERAVMGEYLLSIRTAVMEAVATVEPPPIHPFRTIMVAIDGLLAAVAMYAEAGQVAPTKEDKERFLTVCRDGLEKAMQDARDEFTAGGTAGRA